MLYFVDSNLELHLYLLTVRIVQWNMKKMEDAQKLRGLFRTPSHTEGQVQEPPVAVEDSDDAAIQSPLESEFATAAATEGVNDLDLSDDEFRTPVGSPVPADM